METIQKKNLNNPEETTKFPMGQVELVKVYAVTFGRATLLPGWKWSESVQPIVKTHSCQAPHTIYQISGRMRVRMDDGTEMEFGPGDFGIIPPGHDAWVIGDEPSVNVDFSGYENYAKEPIPEHEHEHR